MKFTVGMLDASPVFLKDNSLNKSSPAANTPGKIQDENTKGVKEETQQKSHSISQKDEDTTPKDLNRTPQSIVELSPSISSHAYSYHNISPSANEFSQDIPTNLQLPWSENLNYIPGSIQDWSLDQFYGFENFQVADDMLAGRRLIQEYDERGNNFAGFWIGLLT